MPFIAAGKLRLYYEEQGQGPRLLYISGTGGDLRNRPTIFEKGLIGFRILAYDQRGMGRSDKPDVPYSMADYAADAVALLEALGWESCCVMGVSFGGMVAQEVALRYPKRVERLVLCCTSSGGEGGSSYPLHELADLPPTDRASRMLGLSDTRLGEAWQANHPEQAQLLIEDIVARFSIGADDPSHQIGVRRQLGARLDHDTWSRLPELKVPTLICGGQFDALAPPANLEALKTQIPAARLEFFKGGHLFFLGDPRAFRTIAAFLKT